jgi:enoyl-CoA hydratase
MTEKKTVRVEHEGAVSVVTIDRPERLNALDATVLSELEATFKTLNTREETRAVIVTGEGKAFVAGADIAAMTQMTTGQAEEFAAMGHRVFAEIERFRCPVIAAVNGFALGGGCELALACDFIHASTKAKLGLPEVTLGLIPGFGGTQRLPRRVGVGHARELIYSGEMIDASEALRIGLVNRVHEPDALILAVKKLAETIATRGPVAVATAKAAVRDGADRPLPEANAIEVRAFGELFRSEDMREGTRAFVEKRKPSFTGR